MTMYTVVQHSGAGYQGDPQFVRGLETRQVSHAATVEAVRRRGGVLFGSYVEAEDFAENAMYPEGYVGLIPQAPGAMLAFRVDGLPLYFPRGDEPGLPADYARPVAS